jgi:predicted porin
MINNTKVDLTSYQVGVHWYYGPGRVMASAAYTKDRAPSASNLTLYALGYDYFLSKRTDLYAVASFIHNQNVGQFSPALAGAPGGFTAKPGEDGHAVLIGMRHRF